MAYKLTFKPEKNFRKLEVNLHGMAKIQTFTIEWSTNGTVQLTIHKHHLP